MRKAALSGFMFGIGSPAYCDEALLIFDRLTGLQPSTALKQLINECLVMYKEQGLFNKKDCIYFRGVHTSELAVQNWRKNAHNSTLYNSPTLQPGVGIVCEGTGKYINNNFVVGNGITYLPGLNFNITIYPYSLPASVWSPLTAGSRNYINDYRTSCRFYQFTDVYYISYPIGLEVKTYSINGKEIVGVDNYNSLYINGLYYGNRWTPNNITDGSPHIEAYQKGGIKYSSYGGKLTPAEIAAEDYIVKYFYQNVGGTV